MNKVIAIFLSIILYASAPAQAQEHLIFGENGLEPAPFVEEPKKLQQVGLGSKPLPKEALPKKKTRLFIGASYITQDHLGRLKVGILHYLDKDTHFGIFAGVDYPMTENFPSSPPFLEAPTNSDLFDPFLGAYAKHDPRDGLQWDWLAKLNTSNLEENLFRASVGYGLAASDSFIINPYGAVTYGAVNLNLLTLGSRISVSRISVIAGELGIDLKLLANDSFEASLGGRYGYGCYVQSGLCVDEIAVIAGVVLSAEEKVKITAEFELPLTNWSLAPVEKMRATIGMRFEI
ncbi:MAG: autotransporter outer membrane beta-barrel domain-containing protein [Alphaproteobacteria bacterium]|nr:autotransporter outer membrane beta-barrel domain-containing protein [Alphaproteobacteria bacterium]